LRDVARRIVTALTPASSGRLQRLAPGTIMETLRQ
jgi:hypothetical protein